MSKKILIPFNWSFLSQMWNKRFNIVIYYLLPLYLVTKAVCPLCHWMGNEGGIQRFQGNDSLNVRVTLSLTCFLTSGGLNADNESTVFRQMKAIGSSAVDPGYWSVRRAIVSESLIGLWALRSSNSCKVLAPMPSTLASRAFKDETLKGGGTDREFMRPKAGSSSSKDIFEVVSPSLL